MFGFSADLGVDLGTANVLIYQDRKGVVLREPSVIAVDKNTGRLLQVGAAARNMLGRTPGNVVAIRPLREGAISDYEMTERMLTQFFRKISRYSVVKPRVLVSVPSGITEVEERAVIQAATNAGARQVYLIEEPLAAALGAGLDLSEASGKLVVDIGGGTTDAAVLSMNGIVRSISLKVAGDEFDASIIRYLRRRYNLLVGETTAEEIKMAVGAVVERPERVGMLCKGRDLKTGLPREVEVTSEDTLEALRRPARQITDAVVELLENTPPELVADISEAGVVLTGGGSQTWGMEALFEERTGIKARVADDAESCVVLGCGKSLKWLNSMQEGTINLARKKLMEDA